MANTDNAIVVNLSGIKRLKVAKSWRLEFDVYEQESAKIKTLVDQIDKDFYLLLVPMTIDKNQNNA